MVDEYSLIFGVSADPLHNAHTDLVVGATKELIARGYSITKIIVIPVYRRNRVSSEEKEYLSKSFEHRFKMAILAAAGIRRRLAEQVGSITVSRIEEQLAKPTSKPNYTVETLTTLRNEVGPDVGFIFPIGSDLISGKEPEFGKWYQLELLIQLAIIAICVRPGFHRNRAFINKLSTKGAQFVNLNTSLSDISSGQIKERLRNGEDPLVLSEEGLLQEPVALYIEKHGLYT